jgi:hypothetical protein
LRALDLDRADRRTAEQSLRFPPNRTGRTDARPSSISSRSCRRWRSFDDENTLVLTETIYRAKLRPYGKTLGSLTKVHLPNGLADELRQWKKELQGEDGKDVSPDAFIFPNADGGFLHVNNYLYRVLKPLAEGWDWRS